MACIARLLNDADAGHRPNLNTRVFHGMLLLLGYRLIHFSPLNGPRPIFHLENAVHLGLIAFMMPFMHRLDGKVPDSPLLSRLIVSAMEKVSGVDKDSQEFLLWIMLVGGASIFTQPKDGWLISMISQKMYSLNLHTWEDVARIMAKYPWIDAFHGKVGKSLCTEPDICDQFVPDQSLRFECREMN